MHTQLERDSQGYAAALDVSRLFYRRHSHALEPELEPELEARIHHVQQSVSLQAVSSRTSLLVLILLTVYPPLSDHSTDV